MDEIADLIRLWAEAPAEEAPMSRPKEFLDRLAMERVAQQGVVQPGPAVPNAAPSEKQQVSGQQSNVNQSSPYQGPQPSPRTTPVNAGPTAGLNVPEPTSGPQTSPAVPQPASGRQPGVNVPQPQSGPQSSPNAPARAAGSPAAPLGLESIAGAGALPRQNEPQSAPAAMAGLNPQSLGIVAQIKPFTAARGPAAEPAVPELQMGPVVEVTSPTTMAGRAATANLMQQFAGAGALPKDKSVEVHTQINPRTSVTFMIPEAFPVDPLKAWGQVDRELQLPPWQEQVNVMDLGLSGPDDVTEPSNAYSNRLYTEGDGASSDVDRWSL